MRGLEEPNACDNDDMTQQKHEGDQGQGNGNGGGRNGIIQAAQSKGNQGGYQRGY